MVGFLAGKLHQKWLIPSASVLKLSEHFAQDWPLGFTKNDIPKLAIAFKVLLGTAQTRHVRCQVIRLFKVGWREVTVCWFEDER